MHLDLLLLKARSLRGQVGVAVDSMMMVRGSVTTCADMWLSVSSLSRCCGVNFQSSIIIIIEVAQWAKKQTTTTEYFRVRSNDRLEIVVDVHESDLRQQYDDVVEVTTS